MKNNKTFVITLVITLLPMIFVAAVYDRLPETVATHWGVDGQPDGWSPRWFLFLLPVILAALLPVLHLTAKHGDPRAANTPPAMRKMSYGVIPAVSVIGMTFTVSYAMGTPINIVMIAQLLVGLLLVFVGNYMPKCRQNAMIGIRLPWTLADADNWNFTHRVNGRVWMIGGVAMLIGAFMDAFWVMPVILLVIVFMTVGASLWYKMSHRK